MKFTSRGKNTPIVSLGMALALTGMGANVFASEGTLVPQTLMEQNSSTAGKHLKVVPAVMQTRVTDSATSQPQHYQQARWFKDKHWWKRNAPIIGGAAGGALIGGLAGGGGGALIGGAAGGGGGYLYKRMRRNHHHPHD
jgi:uncharacterized protein YcfJ